MFILIVIFGLSFWMLSKRDVNIGKNVLISSLITYLSIFVIKFTLSSFSEIFMLVILFYGIYKIVEQIKINNERKLWEEKEVYEVGLFDFQEKLLSSIDTSTIRYVDDIPYNRVEYFSMNFSEKVVSDNNFPLLFDPYTDKKEMLFQEYGYLFTTTELIVRVKNTDKKTKDENVVLEYIIPYDGVYKIVQKKKHIIVYSTNFKKKVVLISGNQQNKIVEILNFMIESGWSKIVTKAVKGVSNGEIIELDSTIEERMNLMNRAVNVSKRKVEIKSDSKNISNSSTFSSSSNVVDELNSNQINDRFGGGQGHGHAGEQFGNVKDRFLGKNAQAKGNDHSKHGADRVVNGVNIQTKYCATAGKSIGQCFDSNGAKYINSDGSMMQIEVPRDQYSKSLKNMENRIKNGQVPNETNPNNAKKYVKKGAISYEHTQIATKSIFDRNSEIPLRDNQGKVVKNTNGEIVMKEVTFGQKLVFSAGGDILTGASVALPTAMVSSVWIYCNCKWKGQENDEAIKQSLIGLAKPCLVSGFVYCVSSQFAGSSYGKKIGAKVITGAVTKKEITQKMTGTIAMGLTVGIVVGPDIVDCLRGRISMNQLVKNTIVTGAGMAGGAAIGGAVGSVVPIVGTAVGTVAGGVAGSMAAKKVLDNLVEDDAISMIGIAKEEFIEVIIMAPLDSNEFEEVLNTTFLSKKFPNMLKEMFASGEPTDYIHEKYLKIITEILKKRTLPNEEDIIEVVKLGQYNYA